MLLKALGSAVVFLSAPYWDPMAIGTKATGSPTASLGPAAQSWPPSAAADADDRGIWTTEGIGIDIGVDTDIDIEIEMERWR